MWRDESGSARWWLLPSAVLLADLVVIAFVMPSGPIRDEVSFYRAAQAFERWGWLPGPHRLYQYGAPQTPLAYYLAGRVLALWPRLWLLRVGNALLMGAALLRFAWFAKHAHPKNALFVTAALASNPYYHLVATHFYSDGLYFFLVVLLITRPPTGRAWPMLGLLPLTRQFGVVFAFGEALQSMIERRYRATLVALVTLLPLFALFAWWRGVTPSSRTPSLMSQVHRTYGFVFPYISAYHLAALGFYAAPVVLRIERSRRFAVGAVLGCALSLFAPAHQNFASQLADPDNQTLGLLHRASLLLGEPGSRVVLGGFAGIGGGLTAEALFVPGALRWFVALFVVTSAFNFQAWDKYVLEALPSLLLALLALRPRPVLAPQGNA
jgi:hypothetical protein